VGCRLFVNGPPLDQEINSAHLSCGSAYLQSKYLKFSKWAMSGIISGDGWVADFL